MPTQTRFSSRLLRWWDRHGRKDLPWQEPRDAYRCWVSEIMLQQTQVTTVIPYFQRFMERFPTLSKLAAAEQDEVLALWAGLGYYSRARNLLKAAVVCKQDHAGELPRTLTELVALPGIGRSTAAAILAQTFNEPHAILDGNVKRVLARHAGIHGWPGKAAVTKALWAVSESRLPNGKKARNADYTQAIMDLGATVCRRSKPLCHACPVASDCVANKEGLVEKLPERKPRAKRRERSVFWLVAFDAQQRILLERRPPSGIWGGLYSLPETGNLADWQLDSNCVHQLEPFRHSFSHFDLHVTPVTAPDQPPQSVHENDSSWFSLNKALHLGVPAPVKSLIQQLIINPELIK